MAKKGVVEKPVNTDRIVLHSCCAPCSSALVEYLLEQNMKPVIFYYNPNIFPVEEYETRKSENKRYAKILGVDFIDTDCKHKEWVAETWELRNEPEKGKRCLLCFKIRLVETARFAHENGYSLFATTLATSCWKDLAQINEAGEYATQHFPGVSFWANNWRKGGLTERKAQIVRQYNFYRQTYCGCEYSLREQNHPRECTGKCCYCS